MGPRIAIAYYSMYGHIRQLAEAEKKGIEEAGGSVTLFQYASPLPNPNSCFSLGSRHTNLTAESQRPSPTKSSPKCTHPPNLQTSKPSPTRRSSSPSTRSSLVSPPGMSLAPPLNIHIPNILRPPDTVTSPPSGRPSGTRQASSGQRELIMGNMPAFSYPRADKAVVRRAR
jgi:hypothetical protein